MTRFNNKNWFYFSLLNKGPERLITVHVENMAYNWSMWKNGIAPVYRSNYTNWQWAFLDHFPLKLRLKEKAMQLSFKYRLRENEKVFIALSYPWTYTTDRSFYAKLEQKYENHTSVYFEKEILTRSLQGRRVQMVTITNKPAAPNGKGSPPDQGAAARNADSNSDIVKFPQLGSKSRKLFLGRTQSNTRFFPNKKYIVLSARVHPSEVASSYVLKSFVLELLRKHNTTYKS